MPWEKGSGDLAEAFAGVAPGGPGAEPRRLFGYPASFIHGNMIMGLHEAGFLIRLNPADREAALAVGATQFAPMGRIMTEYVLLPPEVTSNPHQLRAWVDRSYAFVAGMPAKEKKPRAGKAARPR